MQKVVDVATNALGGSQLPTQQLGKNGPYVTQLGYGKLHHLFGRKHC